MNEISENISTSGVVSKKQAKPMLSINITSIAFSGVEQAIKEDGKYYLPSGSGEISMQGKIEGGSIINLPLIKLVAQRMADDKPSGEELYFNGSVVAGIMSVNGSFPVSSNYKFTEYRNNRALDRLGAEFNLSFKTLDFLS